MSTEDWVIRMVVGTFIALVAFAAVYGAISGWVHSTHTYHEHMLTLCRKAVDIKKCVEAAR